MLAVEAEGTLSKFYGGLFAPLFPFDALWIVVDVESSIAKWSSAATNEAFAIGHVTDKWPGTSNKLECDIAKSA